MLLMHSKYKTRFIKPVLCGALGFTLQNSLSLLSGPLMCKIEGQSCFVPEGQGNLLLCVTHQLKTVQTSPSRAVPKEECLDIEVVGCR